MEDNISSTLEMIELQEKANEAKLKEKREMEDTLTRLNRGIREARMQAEKSEEEQEKLTKSTDSLRKQKALQECRRDEVAAQLNSLKKELKELRAKSNEKISKVWEMRSSFCKEIHTMSDACDIWSLLIKPGCTESVSRNMNKKVQLPTGSDNEKRLQAAIQRRIKALAERDRLMTEPENGEEFVRIKNALRYSLNKIGELND